MINQGNNVPDKTIAVWLDDHTLSQNQQRKENGLIQIFITVDL